MQEIHSTVEYRVCKPGAGSQSGETAKLESLERTKCMYNTGKQYKQTLKHTLLYHNTNINFTLKQG